jgi:hypothetical protein
VSAIERNILGNRNRTETTWIERINFASGGSL